MTSLYLASGSPRRQELLAQLGVTFERIVTGIEEQRQPQESAQQYVVRLAREKARAGVAQTAKDLPVLGADTIVILNGEVLGETARRRACGADVAQIIGSDPSGDDGSGVELTASTFSIAWWSPM